MDVNRWGASLAAEGINEEMNFECPLYQ